MYKRQVEGIQYSKDGSVHNFTTSKAIDGEKIVKVKRKTEEGSSAENLLIWNHEGSKRMQVLSTGSASPPEFFMRLKTDVPAEVTVEKKDAETGKSIPAEQTQYKVKSCLLYTSHFDLELVNAAGLLHDIARVKEHHWDVGADFAEKLGYVQEAAIIRVHMTYSPFHPITQATETDLVCLADRLVKEDRYVGIDERVQYIIDKAVRNGHPEAEPRILEKKEELKEFVHEIEVEIHMTVDELMKYGYAE